MKEMEYTTNLKFTGILDKGIKDGFYWCIVSLGIHPCAYVAVTKDHPYFEKNVDDIPIDVHGGITYDSNDLQWNPVLLEDVWWIGWDYGHAGDFSGCYLRPKMTFTPEEKKWTTQEIKNEVFKVIEQLKKAQV